MVGDSVVPAEAGAELHVDALEVEPHACLRLARPVSGVPGQPAADEQDFLAGGYRVLREMVEPHGHDRVVHEPAWVRATACGDDREPDDVTARVPGDAERLRASRPP